MVGVTIDHLVATIAFTGAILLFIGLFTQTLQVAILYQQNRHVALKCSDLLDSVLLNPGHPYRWGESNTTLSLFGLQQPGESGYSLSSFALMRLLSSWDRVYYNRTGEWYSNVSWGQDGGYLLLPVSDSIDYDTAARLLGVNGTYGFHLTIQPTLDIRISEIQPNPLQLEVQVEGPGFPLSGAALDYSLFWVYGKDPVDETPVFNYTSGSAQTSVTGLALLNFSTNPFVDGSTAYTILVHAQLGGLIGAGYKSRDSRTSCGKIIPFIDDFENGEVLIAHDWNKNDNQGALHYNATFFTLSEDFELNRVMIPNSTGVVNYGQGKPFYRTQIPTTNTGFLVVSYCKGNEYGMVIMPWGISPLGVSVFFGGEAAGNAWVATDLRQVIVSKVAYQAKLTCWSLEGYQVWNPGLWW